MNQKDKGNSKALRGIRQNRREFLRTSSKLGAVALGVTGLGWLSKKSARASDEPLKIGWVRPTTGILASTIAPLFVNGLIAIDEINAQGGILGRQIVRTDEDDEGSPAKEPAIIRKLQEEKVNIVVGPCGSSQTLSALSATTPARMIHAGYAFAVEMGDGKKYPYHYQLSFNAEHQAEATVRHLVEVLKLKKIGILQENTAYGQQIAVTTRALLKRSGLEPAAVEVYPITTPDMGAYVSNLQRAGVEGLIGWVSNIRNAAMAFNAMNSLRWYPPVAGQITLFSDVVFDLVPLEALKNVYGTCYRSFTWTDTESPGARQVEYAKKFAKYPEVKSEGVSSASSPYYDFLHLLKAVIEDEKSFDAERIKRAFDNVRGYKGIVGTLNLSPTNHCAISVEEMVMGSLASGKDPKAMGIFRKRATA